MDSEPTRPKRKIRLPSSSAYRKLPHAYMKIVTAVCEPSAGIITFDGMLHKPGAEIDAESLPCPCVLIERAGFIGPRQAKTSSDALYILWFYNRDSERWVELLRAQAHDWSWMIIFKQPILNILQPKPKPMETARHSQRITEELLGLLDQHLASADRDVRVTALHAIYEEIVGLGHRVIDLIPVASYFKYSGLLRSRTAYPLKGKYPLTLMNGRLYRRMEDTELDCYECGGEGWLTADCFEDSCCCVDPETEHGVIPCPICNPRGDR
jgi:hypothetical protein